MMTKAKIRKNLFITGLLLIMIGTSAWVAVNKADFPKPTGPYQVGTFQVELLDKSRKTKDTPEGRKLIVQFYYPAQQQQKASTSYTPHPALLEEDLKVLYGIPKPLLRKITSAQVPVAINTRPLNTGQRFPLLIFSHGFNGSRFQNSFMLPELVSQGYIIASIEHTTASSGTIFADGSTGHTTHFDSLMFNEPYSIREVHKWSLDQRFVLNQIEQLVASGKLSFGGLLNLKKVGVFGHSFGGATSAATLTEDNRFLAGINMDGFYFGEAYKKGFEQPFMELRADNKPADEMSEKELKDWKFTREQYQNFLFDEWYRRISSYARNGFESYSLRYANHMSFSDFTLMMPFGFVTAPHREEHHQLANHLVLDFFDRHLKGMKANPIPTALKLYIK